MAVNDAHYNKTLDEINVPNTGDTTAQAEYAADTPLTESSENNTVNAEAANSSSNNDSRITVPVISIPLSGGNASENASGCANCSGGNSSGCANCSGGNSSGCTNCSDGNSAGCAGCSGGDASGGMITWWPAFPTVPGMPNLPSMSPQFFGQVRFLNASVNAFTVNISIDNTIYALNSRFGTISNYDRITDGFHTVTVRRASGMRSVLLQQSFPFAAGQKVTMVLTDSSSGGLEMIRVIDTGCSNLPMGSGCYRFANMSYSGSRFDLLYGNETVFRNIGYQRVSSYKQAVAGTYPFTAANSNAFNAIRELPIIVIGAAGTSPASRTPAVSFNVSISPGGNYTSYLIGNTWSGYSLQVMTVSDS